MKPKEYYNYPKRKRIWWLPLAAVLLLVVGTALWHALGGGEAGTEATDTAGPVQQDDSENYHTILVKGQLYYVLDKEYTGEYDLQTLRFLDESWEHDADSGNGIPLENGRLPEGFRQETVMDRAAYEAYCRAWGLTPAFAGHDGNYAVLACVSENAGRVEVRVANAAVEGDVLKLYLLDRFGGAVPDSLGFVLTVPVPDSVTRLETVPVYSETEAEALQKYGVPYDPAETKAPEK